MNMNFIINALYIVSALLFALGLVFTGVFIKRTVKNQENKTIAFTTTMSFLLAISQMLMARFFKNAQDTAVGIALAINLAIILAAFLSADKFFEVKYKELKKKLHKCE